MRHLFVLLLIFPSYSMAWQLALQPGLRLGAPLSSGTIRPQLKVNYENGQWIIRGTAELDKASFNGELFATEKLSGRISVEGRGQGNNWRGNLQLDLDGGELVWDSLYLNFQELPSQLRTEFNLANNFYALKNLTVENSRHYLKGDVLISPQRRRIHLKEFGGDGQSIYNRYGRPFLGNSTFADLSIQGSLAGNFLYDNGFRSLNLILNKLAIKDNGGRYEIHGLDGQLGNDGRPSRLRFQGGRWRAVPIGSGELNFIWKGRSLTLKRPLEVPIADGALVIKRLWPQAGGYGLAGELRPITLTRLSSALDGLNLNGRISGQFPNLFFSWQRIYSQRPLVINIFGGQLQIDRAQLEGLFSTAPLLHFNVQIKDIDLQLLTHFLKIGTITGLLDGWARNVRLVNWQLNAFEMELKADRGRRRIDHRAVNYLTSIGGASALLGQFVRFLNSFPYDRLGFHGVLHKGVLTINGFERHRSGGYYLLKGTALPRLDIIAFQREIDFKELIKRLKSAISADSPIIE